MVDLTLDDATTRALERNLDIAVERLNPQTFDFSIAALDATYRPTFTSNAGVRSQSQFPRSQTAGARHARDRDVHRQFRRGAELSSGAAAASRSRSTTTVREQSDLFATRNPVLNTNLNAVYIQPILRGFRIDGTRRSFRSRS